MKKSNLHMFGPKSISTLLFYMTRLAAIGYSIFAIFVLFAITTGVPLKIKDNQFAIKIPFSESVIKGTYDPTVFITIIGFMLFYATFFFFISKAFQEFKGSSPFTKKAIRFITYFSRLNIIFPFLYLLLVSTYIDRFSISDFMSALLHVTLGLFAWFIVIVFRRGFELQEDNNLTI